MTNRFQLSFIFFLCCYVVWASPLPYSPPLLSLGYYHAAAIIQGKAYSWGANDVGQLGSGTRSDQYIARPVLLIDNPIEVCTGAQHTCFRVNQTLLCTGSNSQGQLGNGNSLTAFVNFLQPIPMLQFENISRIACGTFSTCVVTMSGGAYCWGSGFRGQLGNGQFANNYLPQRVLNFEQSGVLHMSAGHSHTCLLTTTAAIWCAGSDSLGQLGDDMVISGRSTFAPVLGLSNNTALTVQCGKYHTCALLQQSLGVRCWGRNVNGELGTGDVVVGLIPQIPVGLNTGNFQQLAGLGGSSYSSCVIFSSTLHANCFGNNPNGKLGQTPQGNQLLPLPFLNTTGIFQLQSGEDFSCLLLVNDSMQVYCLGKNEYGKLGNNQPNVNSRSLVQVIGFVPTMTPTRSPSTSPSVPTSTSPTFFSTVTTTTPTTSTTTTPALLSPIPTSSPSVVSVSNHSTTLPPPPINLSAENPTTSLAIGLSVMAALLLVLMAAVLYRRHRNRNVMPPPTANPPPLAAMESKLDFPPGKTRHVFLSHAWGENNKNHLVVAELADLLRQRGLVVWFDQERLTGDIERQISDGLRESLFFVVCVTRDYIAKVENVKNFGVDWCEYEWSAAMRSFGKNKTIVVATEPESSFPGNWAEGRVKNYLGSHLVVNATTSEFYPGAADRILYLVTEQMEDVYAIVEV